MAKLIKDLVAIHPDWAAWLGHWDDLADLLTESHINSIVEQEPVAAAAYLTDRLTDAQVVSIVEQEPGYAATYLADRLTNAQRARIKELTHGQ